MRCDDGLAKAICPNLTMISTGESILRLSNVTLFRVIQSWSKRAVEKAESIPLLNATRITELLIRLLNTLECDS